MTTGPTHQRRRRLPAGLLALALFVPVACTAGEPGPGGDLRGQQIEVLAVWSGTEQDRFERVIAEFERRTGVRVTYASAGHGVPADLGARMAEGRPPDVAFLPQPGLLRSYAAEGRLVALDDVVGDLVGRNYGRVWRDLATWTGRLYGVWFKAANKSLVWYNVRAFEQAGVVPPTTIDRLLEVAVSLSGTGLPAFSVGGSDGWTLTDWFENLYLRAEGPERYDMLADRRLPWTDESVRRTLALLSRVLDPDLMAGGSEGALATSFESSVTQTFATPPAAAMVFEGDFVGGFITGRTPAELGIDADVFPFPAFGASPPTVVGGGDAAVLLRRSLAGEAFIRYLAGADAAALWASSGGFVSPNRNLDLALYPDEISRSVARRLLEAGDDFRFDLSDLQPAAFGATAGQGLRGGLQEFLRSRDVDATARRLEADAAAAFGR